MHHQYSFTSFFFTPNVVYSIIQGGRSLIYAGSPFVVSLLEVLDFSYDFLESYASFWDTPTRVRILASLESVVYHHLR